MTGNSANTGRIPEYMAKRLKEISEKLNQKKDKGPE